MVATLLALSGGCGQLPTSAPPSGTAAAATGASAATGPSEQARMVCEPEAQDDIAVVLGVQPTTVGPFQYADGSSTCRYTYPQAGFTLVVQDLPDPAATTAAFEALAGQLGRVGQLDLTGPGSAFTTTGGSMVLRKDTKVLLVDVTDLPATFGNPAVPRAQAALLITKAVLGCWTG